MPTLDGLIVKEQSGFFWVETADQMVYMCRLRGRLLEEAQASDIAAIGDRVQFEPFADLTGAIEAVAARTSAISRAVRTEGSRGAGGPEREQVIIANADQALFMVAAAQPAPSLHNLDRFLVMGEKAAIPNIAVVVNKIDLVTLEDAEKTFARYRRIGYDVLFTSALRGDGIDDLRARLSDKISVLTGPSGVGKSTLLNHIQPGLRRAVKAVSTSNQEGMHTTRDSELVKIDGGGYLADTPGLRAITVWDVEPEEVDAYFREIAPLVAECRFGDCTHRTEPGCAVIAGVLAGRIAKSRYQSYVRLRAELVEAYALN